MNEGEQRFLEIIKDHGWHVTQVRNTEEQEGPTFSYSTGIYRNFGKPELIVFGLSNEMEKWVINEYGNEIQSGKREFYTNSFYDGFLEDFDVCMIDANENARKEYACWADWYYDRKPFPIFQCIYPTTSGVWPWDDGASETFKESQPLFGAPPQTPK